MALETTWCTHPLSKPHWPYRYYSCAHDLQLDQENRVLVLALPLARHLVQVISLCWPQFVYTQNKATRNHLSSFQLWHPMKSNQGSGLAVNKNENGVDWTMDEIGAPQKYTGYFQTQLGFLAVRWYTFLFSFLTVVFNLFILRCLCLPQTRVWTVMWSQSRYLGYGRLWSNGWPGVSEGWQISSVTRRKTRNLVQIPTRSEPRWGEGLPGWPRVRCPRGRERELRGQEEGKTGSWVNQTQSRAWPEARGKPAGTEEGQEGWASQTNPGRMPTQAHC